ncbi:MAG: T9SS type A sorting domain-containing protein [Bacteroidetes bacterium]|nr:T9SS type A sorting domain-containing protein [Bacteroidota bacterium]
MGDKGFVTFNMDRPFDKDNKFFLYVYSNGINNTKINEIRLPLEYVSDNTYSYKLLPEMEGKNYHAVLESTAPYCKSTNYFSFSVEQNYKVKILTEKLDIPFGVKGTINVQYGGNADYNTYFDWVAEKANKVPITNIENSYDEKIKKYTVEPLFSDVYKITSAAYRNCTRSSIVEGKTNINVTSGFNISEKNKPISVCENGQVNIIIKKLGTFPSDNKFKFEFSYSSTSSLFFDAYFINDTTLRVDHINSPFPGKIASGNLWVISTNPNIKSLKFLSITINSTPTLTLSNPNNPVYNSEAGKRFDLPVIVNGSVNVPYSMLINDGKNDFSLLNTGVFPISSTTYNIKEVSNVCGKTSLENKIIKVQVSNPQNIKQSISINMGYQPIYCKNKPIDVPFVVNGESDTSDVYTVEAIKYENSVANYIELGSSKKFLINITIPGVFSEYTSLPIRITNKKRKISSPDLFLYLDDVPKANFIGAFEKEGLFGTPIILQFNAKSYSEMAIEFSTGEKISQSVFNSGSGVYNFSKFIEQSTIFSISRITNRCGVGSSTGEIKIDTKPYKFIIENLSNLNYCEGEKIYIRYGFEGNIPQNFNAQVQISESYNQNYGDLPTKVEGEFLVATIPVGLLKNSPKFYLRIKDNNETGYPSTPISISINKKPDIKLVAQDNSDIAIYSKKSQGAQLKIINLNGAFGFKYGLFPATNVSTSYSYTDPRVSPDTSTIYSIRYAYNECGYGKFQGSVNVKAAASLILNNIPQLACLGTKIKVDFSATGDFESNNIITVELQNLSNNVFTKIGETKLTGLTKEFLIPNDLASGNYYVNIKSSAPALSSNSNYLGKILKVEAPPLGNLQGNSISNQGEKVNLVLKLESGTLPVVYELSDGTKGTVQFLSVSNSYLIPVSPKFSTNYSINKLINSCGTSKSDNQVTITVNDPQPLLITTTNVQPVAGKICAGKSIMVNFSTSPSLNGNEVFTVQISDKNGDNFINVPTKGSTSPITADLPSSLLQGEYYRVRVVSNVPSASSAFHTTIPLRIAPVGQLLTNKLIYEPTKDAVAKIKLSGTFPIYFSFGIDSLKAQTFIVKDSLYYFNFVPAITEGQALYKLFKVSNSDCGVGTLVGDNRLRIELLTGTEPQSNTSIEVFPNPFQGILNINTKEKIFFLKLTNSLGKVIIEENFFENKELNINNLPTGTYYLTINHSNFKVVKL